MNRTQKSFLIGGALLVLAMALLSRGLKPSPPPEQKQNPATPPVTALIRSGVRSAIPRRTAKIELVEPPEHEFDPYEEWELNKIFDNFMVPPGRFEATNMRAAIDQLGLIYSEHGGRRGLSFKQLTNFDPNLAIAFDHGNISFRQLLGIVAGLGHCKAELDDDLIVFKTLGSDSESEIELRVPPHLTSSAVTDESTGEIVEVDRRRTFEEYGLIFSDEVEIIADPRTSTWSVTGEPAEVEHVKSVMESIAHVAPQQVFISQKFITTENGPAFDPQTYATDAEYGIAIRAMLEDPGVNLVSAPSVVTRPGQRAKVEIIREVIYPTATDANGEPSDFEMRPVGMSFETNPILAGLDRIQLQGATELTAVGDQHLRNALALPPSSDMPAATDEEDFRTHATDFDGQLVDGNTAFIETAQEDGTTVYQFISVRRIDTAGLPLLSDD